MKNLSAILTAGIFVLFFIYPIAASGYSGNTESAGGVGSMMEAIKHAEMAKEHRAHAEHMHEHAKESLEYVKKAQIEAIESGNDKGKAYITESIQHLVEAIKHAKLGHARIAHEHITDALAQMYQFTEQ